MVSVMATIGKRNTLTVIRDSTPGIYLDGGELGEILLPNRYVPQDVAAGDRLDVFIYRDSEDRLVATTEQPHAGVGDVATLRVLSLHPRVGAFLDWGLPKDLLLPFREQTGPLEVGQEVAVRVYLDEKTQRVVASMKLGKHAPAVSTAGLRAGQAVSFLITEPTPLGYKALVEGIHSGVLFRDNLTLPITVGETLKGYVRSVRPDGKLDLSLDQAGYRRVKPLAQQILEALQENGGRLEYDDESSPEAIRVIFGVSKKAFKQALGTLYKARRLRFCHPGIELLDNSNWAPGAKPPAA